jgi:hypothetical protein
MPRKKKPLILTQPVKALEFWKQRYPKLEVIG